MTRLSTILVLIAVLATATDAFTTPTTTAVSTIQQQQQHVMNKLLSTRQSTTTTMFASGDNNDSDNIDFSDLPPEESTEYTGSVDWDAEWKKVVASEGKVKTERPGKDFYKSEAEIAAIKAANKANEKITTVSSGVTKSLPDIRSLSGDWRFWIAILALVSVGLSLLTAPQPIPTGLQGDSYYI